jgi:DNA-binding beta-propeller fold protein YncE
VASKLGDWLYSLYLDPSHGPFIHALPIDDPQFAFCIDLPTDGKDDPAKQSRWSLLMSADKRTLYAANGALGLVAEYSLGNGVPQLVRTEALFDRPDAASVRSSPARPGINSITALAPDGKTLYALAERGLLVIDTQRLTLRGRYLPDWSLDGVAISPDSARLYAASAAQGKIVRLDPATGTIAAEVPAAGQPSGLVRVE